MRPTSVHGLSAVMAIGVALVATPGHAAPALVGTLTCTAEAAPAEAKQSAGWKLSCAFERVNSSSVQQYQGEITGLDKTMRASGKALLAWNVLTSGAQSDSANLIGTYKTTEDAGLPKRSLVGGRDQTVILQPIDNAEKNVAPAVHLMRLDLPKA